ncbi:hypothetical protein [Actinacidiphila yeochonensis]|uniref:hypothetical protein n=1 Tax=Actinacidiphila yeochonensis TaxID=89050 RepID=UPI00068F6D70|nr:hypothetical protein [Actinacidiphila yeochonensis]
MRRGIAVTTAAALVLEALAIALVGSVLGLAVRRQNMSLAGLRTDAMAAGAWTGGGVLALFLAGCAVLVVRIAVRDRTAGRVGRVALTVCAVEHAVAGAAAVGLAGWAAFGALMVVLALLVATLLFYAPEGDRLVPVPGSDPDPGAPGEAAPPAAA